MRRRARFDSAQKDLALYLEARDLNHAIALVSQLPGFKYGLGPVEIRPVVDLSEIIKESEQRRRRKDASR